MNKFKINIPIYDVTCLIIVGNDISNVIRNMGKKRKWGKGLLLGEEDNVHGYAVPIGDLKNYIIFYAQDELTPNLISHEISHLVDFILGEKGIELTGEGRAYLTGHISEKVYEYANTHQLIKWTTKKPRVKKSKIEENEEQQSGLLREVYQAS